MSPLITSGNLTLKDLVSRILQGDAKSQETLFHNYAPRMMGICKRYIKDSDDAKDVFQEGFINVFNHIHLVENIDSFDFWIRRIFINCSLQHIRRNHVIHTDIDQAFDLAEQDQDAVSSLSTQEILQLLDQLPIGYKTVFNLYVVEGFSHKEIGEMLNIEEATSRSQLIKARRMLQDKIHQLNIIAI
jgi:RNA polymerase sigma factor (sigma-70 family)